MEKQWAVSIVFIVSTVLLFPQIAKSRPGNVDVDVKVHVNGKKVIEASHSQKTDGKGINPILFSLRK